MDSSEGSKHSHDPIEEARRAGFDIDLVDFNLSLSHEERVLAHDNALEFLMALEAAKNDTPP